MADLGKRAQASPIFDWLMAVLAAALIGGLLVDGWAHSHGVVDQSFLTPWHALLYGAMALNGFVLLGAGVRGLMRPGAGSWLTVAAWRDALPPGYWTAAIGVTIFAIGGGFDGWWHTRFGIESGIVLLISPPHLILAIAAGLIMSGPLQSIASKYGRDTRGWFKVGPAVVAVWALATLVGFFLAYSQPIEDGVTPTTLRPVGNAAVFPMLYAIDAHGALSRVALPANTDLETVDIAPNGTTMAYRVNRFQDLDAAPPADIFVAGVDGSHPVRITNDGRHDTQPAWSPDGKSIAYISLPAETSGNFQVRVMAADGSGDRTLVDQVARTLYPTWSPDGRSIAYESRNGLTPMLAVVDVATGKSRWLTSTAGAGQPEWSRDGIVYFDTGTGAIRQTSPDGNTSRTLVAKTDGSPAVSRDGRHLAYLNQDVGSEQLWVANPEGGKPREVTQTSGLDVQDAAWAPDGRLFFVSLGRRDPTLTDLGKSLAMSALIIQSIVMVSAVLLLLRRWNPPIGAITLVLTCFSLAMAMQSDFYPFAIGAAICGILADAAIFFYRERIRSGIGFYALGAMIPLLFTAFFETITVQVLGGTGWTSNLLVGAPAIAGIAGLLIAFCFAPPLEPRSAPASS